MVCVYSHRMYCTSICWCFAMTWRETCRLLHFSCAATDCLLTWPGLGMCRGREVTRKGEIDRETIVWYLKMDVPKLSLIQFFLFYEVSVRGFFVQTANSGEYEDGRRSVWGLATEVWRQVSGDYRQFLRDSRCWFSDGCPPVCSLDAATVGTHHRQSLLTIR